MARFLLRISIPLLVITLILAGLMGLATAAGNGITGRWLAARAGTGIHLMDADRLLGVRINLTRDANSGGLSWSPDGRYLVFSLADTRNQAGLHVLDTHTGGITPLPGSTLNDFTAEWSPAGDRIAFLSSRDGNFEIYLLDLPSGETRNLTNHTGDDRYPVWSPDGERIAFVASRDNRYDIYDLYVMDIESGRTRQVTETQLIRSPPVWSPDGRLLAYRSEFTGSIEVVTRGGLPQFRIDDDHNYYQPEWSPDGTTLALYADRNSRYTDIYLTSDEGASFAQITNGAGSEVAPVWSPEGTQIAFLADGDPADNRPQTDLFIIDMDGSNLRRITFTGDIYSALVWQPNR